MKKRILCYTENYDIGGGNKYLIDVINSLDQSLYEVILVSNKNGFYPFERNKIHRKIIYDEISIFSISFIAEKLKKMRRNFRRLILVFVYLVKPLFYLLNIYIFIKLLNEYQPWVVHSFNGGYPAARSCLALVIAARMKRINNVLNIVSLPINDKFYWKFFGKIRDLVVRRNTDFIIVNAEAIKKHLLEKKGFRRDNISVIYNGIPREGECKPKEFNMDFDVYRNNKILVGFVSRMDFTKGPVYLVEAFKKVSDEFENINLIFVGWGNAFDFVKKRIKGLGIEKKVLMTDYYKGNIFNILKSLDIFVFPSLHEGFPYSILEAMKAECAIISTNVGGISEAIRDGIEGYLVPPRDSNSIYEKIKYLVCYPDERNRIGRNARKRFEKDFVIAKMKSRINEFYGTMD